MRKRRIDEFMLKGDFTKKVEYIPSTIKGKITKDRLQGDRKMSDKFGIGLDVGTGFLVGAGFVNEEISFKAIRNAFMSVPKKQFNSLLFDKNNISYIEDNDNFHIVGDDALDFARIKNGSAQRPLEKGVLNPMEKASALILREMFTFTFSSFIKKQGENLVFSIPGNQVDNESFDTNYHMMSIRALCKKFGVSPIAINEAYAVAISELGTDVTTALSFSFGAGLVNCALTFKGLSMFEFSIEKSGDFIDSQSSKAVGESVSVMSKIKETELDLSKDEFEVSDEERALIFSYEYVIKNTLDNVKRAFLSNKDKVKLFDAIPIVISGGTSMPKGFIDRFKQEIDYVKLPFKVSEVIHAENPLTSVAKGCLLYANSMECQE